MIFYVCGVPGCGAPLGAVDNGDFNIKISHGLCRYHFLKDAIEAGVATEQEKALFELLKKTRKEKGA